MAHENEQKKTFYLFEEETENERKKVKSMKRRMNET